MKNVIGVRFRSPGKTYWFSPGEHELHRGDGVIVETSRGKEFGTVVIPPHDVEDSDVVQPLREIVRPANRIDLEQEAANREREKDAFMTCRNKIRERGLEMKLIAAEYTWDNSKILFYFTADGRVDFRELVRDLASHFKTRIELRQIGVRDETRLIGGYGICGRSLCCHTYLSDFAPVSIKMAKEQNLSLNPSKISGTCGRLLCCLGNEEEVYEEINKLLPGVGDEATTPDGMTGTVISVNVLRQTAKVVVDVGDDREIREFAASELEFVKSNHKRRKKPKIDLTRKSDQKEAREQAIKNAKEQAIAAAIERQNKEKEEEMNNSSDSGNPEEGRERRRPNRRKQGDGRRNRTDGQAPKQGGDQSSRRSDRQASAENGQRNKAQNPEGNSREQNAEGGQGGHGRNRNNRNRRRKNTRPGNGGEDRNQGSET
ncbi:MAG: hypothetical protein K6C95_01230 [Lachnospiraceae bacterium]|nr:hypothetical protein [Lachnospiraceae bacterium]